MDDVEISLNRNDNDNVVFAPTTETPISKKKTSFWNVKGMLSTRNKLDIGQQIYSSDYDGLYANQEEVEDANESHVDLHHRHQSFASKKSSCSNTYVETMVTSTLARYQTDTVLTLMNGEGEGEEVPPPPSGAFMKCKGEGEAVSSRSFSVSRESSKAPSSVDVDDASAGIRQLGGSSVSRGERSSFSNTSVEPKMTPTATRPKRNVSLTPSDGEGEGEEVPISASKVKEKHSSAESLAGMKPILPAASRAGYPARLIQKREDSAVSNAKSTFSRYSHSSCVETMMSQSAGGTTEQEMVLTIVNGEGEGEEVSSPNGYSSSEESSSSRSSSGTPTKGIDMVGFIRESSSVSNDAITACSKNCVETMRATTTGPDFDLIIEPGLNGGEGKNKKGIAKRSNSSSSSKGRKRKDKKKKQIQERCSSPDSFKTANLFEQLDGLSMTPEATCFSNCCVEAMIETSKTDSGLCGGGEENSIASSSTISDEGHGPESTFEECSTFDDTFAGESKESICTLSLMPSTASSGVLKQRDESYASYDTRSTGCSKKFIDATTTATNDANHELGMARVNGDNDDNDEVSEAVDNSIVDTRMEARKERSSARARAVPQPSCYDVELVPAAAALAAAALGLQDRDESFVSKDDSTYFSHSCADTMSAFTENAFFDNAKVPASMIAEEGRDIEAPSLAAVDLQKREESSNSKATKSTCSNSHLESGQEIDLSKDFTGNAEINMDEKFAQGQEDQRRNRLKIKLLCFVFVLLVAAMIGIGFGVRQRKPEKSSSNASISEQEGKLNSPTPTMPPQEDLPTPSEQVANLSDDLEEVITNIDGESTESDEGDLELNGEDGLGTDVDGMDAENEVDDTDTEMGSEILNITKPAEPTEPPTEPPTELGEPNSAVAHATPSKPSYAYGEDILVWFSVGDNTIPRNEDWVILFNLGSGQDSESVPWLYTCNQISVCDDPIPRNGSVVFNEDAAGVWPLPPGDYRPFLYRGQEAPFLILASGPVFEIREP